ncbi:transketolase [Candidatus Peregrinibacteria bacterium]|nr:transketolase [Candidatus Peregrinibacteria bacterium]
MLTSLPKFGENLEINHLDFLKAITKSARSSILQMVTNAQSGHPGGSLSCIDYLAVLYSFLISQTGEKVVVSNGHISPGVYSILAEMGYHDREEIIRTFRQFGSIYEGHVTRHVRGVEYGTGPLGIGVSVASAFAIGEKLMRTKSSQKNDEQKVYALVGDGECQEGQVHEMINFAKHHNLNNLVIFVDYNKVQLTASLKETLNIDIAKIFAAGGFEIIDINAHDYNEIWSGLSKAQTSKKPVVIMGNSIMGYGVDFMQSAGENHLSDWHGKAPKPEQITDDLKKLELTAEEKQTLENFRKNFVKWQPKEARFPKSLSKIGKETGHDFTVDIGKPQLYGPEVDTDCRSAYGKALLDLATKNPQIVALTADLKGSVMTSFVSEKLPDQYIECGIAEQQMVSASGGLSISGFIPFCSTFGAFMSSRAKDQARVNDINYCNVKMVATHCGLSVGEDGPTHQAIDDKSSFLGFFNTMVIEPADPNQTDHIIRYISSHYGNFYVRMGRHKYPVILKENGSIFYDENYVYKYGKCDLLRKGNALTIAVTGACINEALKALALLSEGKSGTYAPDIELIAVSSIKQFDDTLLDSIRKTRKVLTVEDHNKISGLSSQLGFALLQKNIQIDAFENLGTDHYQLSGKAPELYHSAKIDASAIAEKIQQMLG